MSPIQVHTGESVLHPIDSVLKSIKSELFGNFTRKWSKHVHGTDIETNSCREIIVFDGNWKLFRNKCAYDNKYCPTKEFGAFWTGCTNTPAYRSYFCNDHKSSELVFTVNGKRLQMKPEQIKLTKVCKY